LAFSKAFVNSGECLIDLANGMIDVFPVPYMCLTSFLSLYSIDLPLVSRTQKMS
jgi:hypothetical protein